VSGVEILGKRCD